MRIKGNVDCLYQPTCTDTFSRSLNASSCDVHMWPKEYQICAPSSHSPLFLLAACKTILECRIARGSKACNAFSLGSIICITITGSAENIVRFFLNDYYVSRPHSLETSRLASSVDGLPRPADPAWWGNESITLLHWSETQSFWFVLPSYCISTAWICFENFINLKLIILQYQSKREKILMTEPRFEPVTPRRNKS